MTISEEVRATIRRLHFVEHYRIYAISQATGVHHATIKSIIGNDVSVAKGDKVGRVSQLDAFEDVIMRHLEIYPQITAPRLQQILHDHGYKGSLSLLRQRLRKTRSRVKKVYMRMIIRAGEQGQVDWAHCGELVVGRARRKLYMFVAVLSYSRAVYAEFCLNMNTATFLRCHERAFSYWGGVPRVILYDNLKSVVLGRLGKAVRFNDEILSFSGFHGFEPRPCHPYRGNEKGRVERTIRYLRSNYLQARPLTNLTTMNTTLLAWCNQIGNRRPWPDERSQRVDQAWAREKPQLLGISEHRQNPREQQACRSGKMPWINFDLNYSSIPPEYLGQSLLLHADDSSVEIASDGKMIAQHRRSWDKGIYVEVAEHREALLKHKNFGRGNMFRETIVNDFPGTEQVIAALFKQGWDVHTIVRRLHMMRHNFGGALFSAALKSALDKGQTSLEAIQVAAQRLQKDSRIPPSVPVTLPDNPKVQDLEVTPHELKNYDHL